MKLVTIVIPVYNSERLLSRCLKSLVNQSVNIGGEAPFTVLLINDGSTDSSAKVMAKFQTEYPDIFQSVNRENRGAARSRNEGIERCATPYIMFIDNDDYVDCDYIESHLTAIENLNADIVLSGYRREKGSKIISRVMLNDDSWSKYRCVAPWARIFKTDFLKKYAIKFFDNNIGEDTIFSLRAYSYAKNIKCIDYAGYVWCCNDASVSSSLQKGLRPECDINALLENAVLEIPVKEKKLGEYYLYRYVVWYLLFSGKTASPQRFVDVFRELFGLIDEMQIVSEIPFFSRELRSEPLLNKLAVSIFRLIQKFGLEKVFAKIYCRG